MTGYALGNRNSLLTIIHVKNGNLAACPLKLGGGFADRRWYGWWSLGSVPGTRFLYASVSLGSVPGTTFLYACVSLGSVPGTTLSLCVCVVCRRAGAAQ